MRSVRNRGDGAIGTRSRVAAAATVAVSGASRHLRLGGGSVIGGRVGMAIDPDLLGTLASGVRCVLVSGTNGKTTTTRMLTAALGGSAEVATSSAGSNLPPGIAAALASAPGRKTAVLEVDEGYLPRVADAVSPDVVVLLNLSRDQLDRVNEVRMVAERWRDAVARMRAATVVANADDPLVVWAAGAVSPHNKVRFVAAGGLWHDDAKGCPACGGRIVFGEDGAWSCTCGFSRPTPYAALTEKGLEIQGKIVPVDLSLPARCNRANATMAAVAASVLGTDEAEAIAAIADLTEVEGRFAKVSHGGVSVRLLLAKNPAGWAELLDLLAPSKLPVVVGINARVADGHDPSWLWDVAFERLGGRRFVATGERAADLGVRLKYAGLPHAVVHDQTEALSAAGGHDVDYVGNYTAFQQLRRAVSVSAKDGGTRLSAGETRIAPPARRATGAGESALRIAVVFPDLLGTYGDGGNGLVLARRAEWRGWPAELILAGSDRPLPVADIYCIGGGEDAPQVEAANLLSGSVLPKAVDDGAAVLAVCAGFQVVGESFPDASGQPREGLGLLAVRTQKGTSERSVGEVVSEPAAAHIAEVALGRFTGFENHSGLTSLGAGIDPLGSVRSGVGNGDGGRTEGAISGRVVGTYLHGPVLARNPSLADAILSLATGKVPDPLDDEEEEALRSERFAAVSGTGDRHGLPRLGSILRLVRVRRS
jgi:lipid II isoglutaminyl synthase (glutamine-hydrolysing)